jgi:chromosome segregation ATPase
MNDFVSWAIVLGIFITIFFIWRYLQEDRLEQDKIRQRWFDLSQACDRAHKISQEALNAKLEMSRKVADLATSVKDLKIEIYNFQDHLARNDGDLIQTRRDVSLLTQRNYHFYRPAKVTSEQSKNTAKGKQKVKAH